jgi:tRNA 2-selenouridine synthase
MTPLTLTSLDDLTDAPADTIIDVRSPAEFAEDHLPGAINLPVLTDEQRAEVGTIYKQISPFDARKLGGALVAQNTAAHLQGPLADKAGDWQPLIYCWRGGQRSGSFATILDQIGWRVQLLKGGYRSYRRLVVAQLYDQPLPHKITLIAGGTGTAKTRLLDHLREAGAQVLDLEGLAEHRGSLFGGRPGGQPSQKLFESRLIAALRDLKADRMTFVEAESSKIGTRIIPPSLWAAMTSAPQIEIRAPLAARGRYLSRAYDDLTEDRDLLHRQIDKLRPFHSTEQVESWHQMASAAQWAPLAQSLIAEHYDPTYARSAARSEAASQVLDLDDLDESTLATTARHLAATIS